MTQLINSDIQAANSFKSESDLYKFSDRLENEALKKLDNRRNNAHSKLDRCVSNSRIFSDNSNIWTRKPVDFSRRLYDPCPPKRNTREAMKPWTYDKYLRLPEDENIFWEREEEKKMVADHLLENALANSFEDWKVDFERSFRLLTPTGK